MDVDGNLASNPADMEKVLVQVRFHMWPEALHLCKRRAD